MALRLIRDLPGEPAPLLPSLLQKMTSQELGASFGRQNHTISPYARAMRVSRSTTVHRIPADVRDDRERPSDWDGMGNYIV